MKKILYLFILIGTSLAYTSCSNYLEQSSLSDTTIDFVLSDPGGAQAYLDGAYEVFRDNRFHSNGLFYELTVCGSDAGRHPEAYSSQVRHIPENLYYGGTAGFNIDYAQTPWEKAYDIIARCNILISNYETTELYDKWINPGNYPDDVDAEVPNALSNIYGQAVTMRATMYYELCRYFGDVPHQISNLKIDSTLTSRDEIYEYQIAKLDSILPLMYRAGENGFSPKTKMTRTYAEGLAARLCLFAGGYATRRTDLGSDFYKDMDGNTLSFEQIGSEYSGGVYTRRSDYLDFYQKAKTYLTNLIADPGTAQLIETDPRSVGANGEQFGNPFQYVFQQMENLTVSDESIYEIAETQGGNNSERPYAFGRPSGGGGSNAYPCKSYGQARMHPTYYYGDFDPYDMRRDATVAVTASTGGGREILLSFQPGSKTAGGLALNKWDENRMSPPYYQKQRKSGINNPYMRMADIYLMLAEVDAVLGDEGNAKTLLKQIRSRAFPADMQTAKVDNYISSLSGDDLLDAILTERKLEFGGEGLRKWDMIRNGKFPEMIETLKANLADMISGLETNGYYEFENGNIISDYVWAKQVDAKSTYGHRLTTQAPDMDDPVLFPGWRGQYNDWENVGGPGVGASYGDDYGTNTAIEGLFTHIEPGSTEATALEADGYEMKDWGKTLVDYKEEYSDYVFRGYQAGSAPIYLVPINATSITTSNGLITNGYGFDQ
ncbi:RagB/SusD family nutrient uptake outer membrane protein [Mangrovibacterium lignilyticum]|uniref:RagB/SusD family nutrient uptake outer membrane protein n=1 Tax=Mangrovibacterium lignilyticum TaxID=2668052 RepID=UPI0013D322E5|nr:RagB/SusD family nutrient uptake outer membrane protein [Mangrovibacterium lignilyticum]